MKPLHLVKTKKSIPLSYNIAELLVSQERKRFDSTKQHAHTSTKAKYVKELLKVIGLAPYVVFQKRTEDDCVMLIDRMSGKSIITGPSEKRTYPKVILQNNSNLDMLICIYNKYVTEGLSWFKPIKRLDPRKPIYKQQHRRGIR